MPSFFQNLFKSSVEEPHGEAAAESENPTSPDRTTNMNSPFAMTAGEHFTARELSILLPAQFVKADAVPDDQIVQLPLDALRTSLQQGRPALKLSQIFQACPFLFVRQVQPQEDVEVVLPFQKVKRLLDAAGPQGEPMSPFAAVLPGNGSAPAAAPRGASPFAAAGVSPFAAAAAAPPAASPFAQAAPPPATASPFAVRGPAEEQPFATRAAASHEAEILPPPAAPPAADATPFQIPQALESAPGPAASPFGLAPAPAPAPVPQAAPTVLPVPLPEPGPAPVFAPSPLGAKPAANGNGHPPAGVLPLEPAHAAPIVENPPPPQATAKPTIKISLAALLRDVTAQELGFDPSAVPGTVEVEISPDTIMPQLPTGRVEIGIEELRAGVVERFRPAFARVRSDQRFLVPLTEIFRKLPAEALPVAAAPVDQLVTTPPFQTPFALRAEEEKSRSPLPITPLPLPPAPAASAVTPFPPAPPASAFAAAMPSGPAPAPVVSLPAPPAPEPTPAPPPAAGPFFGPPGAPAAPAPAPAAPPIVSMPPPAAATPAPVQKSPAMPSAPTMPKLPNIPGMSGRPSPFARPPGFGPPGPAPVAEAPAAPQPAAPSGDTHEDLGQSFAAGALRAEPPAAAPVDAASIFSQPAAAPVPVPAPAAPQHIPAPAPAPMPAPVSMPVAPAPVAAPVQAPAAAALPDSFAFGGGMDDLVQLALRALFLTPDPITPALIAEKCAAFPGLSACLVQKADGAKYSGSSRSGGEIGHFHDTAHRSIESLRMLALSLDQEPRGVFTLKAGAGLRTIFLERTVSVAVLHTEADFQPGVREKLTLVVRALADMKS